MLSSYTHVMLFLISPLYPTLSYASANNLSSVPSGINQIYFSIFPYCKTYYSSRVQWNHLKLLSLVFGLIRIVITCKSPTKLVPLWSISNSNSMSFLPIGKNPKFHLLYFK